MRTVRYYALMQAVKIYDYSMIITNVLAQQYLTVLVLSPVCLQAKSRDM